MMQRTVCRRHRIGTTIMVVLSFCLLSCNIEGSSSEEPSQISVECFVDLELTEESGVIADWNDEEQGWSYEIEEDQITLTRKGMCGDECGITEEIILSGLSGECPGFVSARTTRTDLGGAGGPTDSTTWAREGTLRMQDWDFEKGIFSGHLESEVVLTFYVRLAKE